MPTLAALHDRFSTQDFSVIAISVDRENTRVEAIAKLKALSDGKLTFYHDPKMAVVFPMKARGFPTSVLADWNGTEAQDLIQAALSEK
jgi:hypothetical protein